MDVVDSEVRALFSLWMGGEYSLIWEYSRDIVGDCRRLVQTAKKRAKLLSLEWSDDLIPEDMRQFLNDTETWGSD